MTLSTGVCSYEKKIAVGFSDKKQTLGHLAQLVILCGQLQLYFQMNVLHAGHEYLLA